jgi:hypothetical protein
MATAKDKPGKILRIQKRDLIAVACILLLTLSVTFFEGWMIDLDNSTTDGLRVQSIVLATYNLASYVPLFLLCGPPRNGSGMVTFPVDSVYLIMAEGATSNLRVVGEFNISGGFYWSTGHDIPYDRVMTILWLNQTWQVVRYSSFGHVWIEAHLVSCSELGEGTYRFDDLPSENVWFDDPTNTTSRYGTNIDIPAGAPLTVTLNCTPHTAQPIGAGYNIMLMGEEVSLSVSIEPLNSSIVFSYSFDNLTEPATYHLYSDAPITQDPLTTDGLRLWFG